MKIAVIGSGISGLSSAFYLSKNHKVDLFEKEDQFGGHAHTIDIPHHQDPNKKIPIDIGFIVFNLKTYPNLINFFKENDVEIEKSNMSFSVKVENTNIEYCGKGLNGIFSRRKNLLNPSFLKMFYEIIMFYKKCSNLKKINNDITLREFLNKNKLSKYFINYHIIPMVSAIWSMPPKESGMMPMKFFLNFFQNHGLFKIRNRPQWFTVKNRSRTYVDKILKKISGEYYKNYNINKIKRNSNGIQIYYGEINEFFDYDKVIIATHADEALNLIENPTNEEKKILSSFKYKKNTVVIHTDENVMPNSRRSWSSWNSYIIDSTNPQSSITYWLNLLENLEYDQNLFLTMNPIMKINSEKVLRKVDFMHPYYDHQSLIEQNKLKFIQNKKNLLFCGSYFGYGFHEDGIKSSLEMIKFIDD